MTIRARVRNLEAKTRAKDSSVSLVALVFEAERRQGIRLPPHVEAEIKRSGALTLEQLVTGVGPSK